MDQVGLTATAWNILLALALGMARPIGFMAVNPVFARGNLTGLLRGAVAIALALPAMPFLAAHVATGQYSVTAVLLLAAKESIMGAILGFLSGAPIWGFQLAGDLLDQQRGATAGRLNDPAGLEDVSITGTLLALAGTTLFVASGGLQVLAGMLYASWSIWPVLSPLPSPTPQAPTLVLSMLDAIFRQGLLLAFPIALAMLLSDSAMMLVARFAPQLRVEDASTAARNLVFCFVLPLYCVILLAAMGQDLIVRPDFLDNIRRGLR